MLTKNCVMDFLSGSSLQIFSENRLIHGRFPSGYYEKYFDNKPKKTRGCEMALLCKTKQGSHRYIGLLNLFLKMF